MYKSSYISRHKAAQRKEAFKIAGIIAAALVILPTLAAAAYAVSVTLAR